MTRHSTKIESKAAQPFTHPLAGIKRPKLLVRAARLGLTDYSRTRDLKRIMRVSAVPSPSKALPALVETEAEMEQNRQAGGSTYSVIRHVEVMIALMAEARLLPRTLTRDTA